MSAKAPGQGNLLDLLRKLLFPQDTDNSNVVKDLKAYRRYLLKQGGATISATSIAKWGEPGSHGPTRPEPLQFIHGYLIWSLSTRQHGIDRSAVEALAEQLAQGLHTTGTDQDAGAEQRDQRFKRWKSSPDVLARLSALEATYQIIRPFVSVKGRYVLEAMAIEMHVERRQVDLMMYSHNQPVDGFMYSGEILPSSRHCFGFVARPDEVEDGNYTFRCMTLNVMHRKIANGYEPKFCMSGLMLRGVKGVETVGNPSVCVPFIAIRAPQNTREFHQAKFVDLGEKLSCLSAESCVLLGEIEEKDGDIFTFCDRVFGQLRSEFSYEMVVQTVRPDKVENAVAPAARTKQDYYGAWAEVAEKAKRSRRPGT